MPSELCSDVRWSENSACTSSILIGNVGFLSAYLFDMGKPVDLFEADLVLTRASLRDLRARGAQTLVMGSDSQVELPPNLAPWTGPHAVGPTVERVAERADRRELLLSVMRDFRLCVASSWLATEQRWTRAPLGRQRGTCRQIDHICVSQGQGTCIHSMILGTAMHRSDNRAAFTL